ncbi:TlpA family protein disulfide reductase [Mucilaginibacter sp.]|uniref:TlpA family protein disulfide reductase n=1 Tax=Mucilaginibacter sp. TaxID=1882438 RepID=UPI003567106A
MRRIISCIFMMCFFTHAIAQQKKAEPLIIQGKITNTTEKILKIFFEDENGKMIIDTIKINDAGEFYLKTYHIKRPQRTSLQQNSLQINRIYVAPGYNLTITGDATNYVSLLKTRKITGIGAETNQYLQKIDSITVARNDRTEWFELKLDELLPYIKKTKALNDSVLNIVFNKKPKQDKYFNTFKKMIDIDNQSMAFYMLLQHVELGKYTYQQMTDIAKQNTPAIFTGGISHDKYLTSDDYKTWIVPVYMAYTKKLDGLKDSSLVKQPDYIINTVNKLYTGKVKDHYLYHSVTSGISRASSIEQLNMAKKELQPRFDAIKNEALKKDITNGFKEKENQLMLVQTGQPAPAFTLPSDKGKIYSLEDFKGKVVYIDLWASWCAPCRAEIPNYKTLYEKYKDNSQVAFMAIAVFDGDREWRKALDVEKPTWLQLYDSNGVVARSYVANAIPKYILIDKNGRVVNFNAPGPGSVEIGKLIDAEIAR